MLELRQSTTYTNAGSNPIKTPIFVDSIDAVTEETGLTINQADILLSKNGQAYAQKNDASAAVHDSGGAYRFDLNTTDTNTLGRLQIKIAVAGALQVEMEFMVVSQAYYDWKYGASGVTVDTNNDKTGYSISGTLTTLDALDTAQDAEHATTQADIAALNDLSAAQVNAECDTALADYDGPTNAEMVARTLLAAQYGTAANQTNIETDTQDIQTRLPAALVGGAMDSSVSAIDAATANTIADHTLRRTFANAWGSADGDAQTFRSLVGAVAKLVNRIRSNAGVLTVYEDDDLTPVGTQTITTDAAALPVVELDT